MKVLVVHNHYRTSAPSGEDVAVQSEQRMLARQGVDVVQFERCNDELDQRTLLATAAMAASTVWSHKSRSALRKVIRQTRPDIMHVHNTFAMLSPSVYGAARAEGLPVVQTLHNFRLFCPSALFLREGKPCEECVDKGLLRSVRYRCYRGSRTATATLATMLALHRVLGTYSRDIDRYVVLTEFARAKVARAGIAASRISVKPNFLADPPAPGRGGGGYVIYVGRLLEGKGTETLVRAWRSLPDIRLKIVGDGALRPVLEAMVREGNLNVEFAGRLDRPAVLRALSEAELMIIPSECYEGFPMVIAESFACGTPVLASRTGSLEELVADGVTGKKFTVGAPEELARSVRELLADPAALKKMRHNSRAYFDANLTEQQNYSHLRAIYRQLLSKSRPRGIGDDSILR
jgi:glycosyltransferase involved in cell wall biosynthesis